MTAETAKTSNAVALRKESVDRNTDLTNENRQEEVALRKESVDRNTPHLSAVLVSLGRSPQGERG